MWGLDTVAGPLKEPFRFRAPFLDERPIRFTKELKEGVVPKIIKPGSS